MSAIRVEPSPALGHSGKRIGYSIAIVINLAMLVAIQNLLGWGWLPFLTSEFAEAVPWISIVLVVSIVTNLIYQLDDSRAVKAVGQIMINTVSAFATYVVLRIFPFDFSDTLFDWTQVAQIVLILGIVGAGVGAVVELIRFIADRVNQQPA